jgi:hypothetical protein
MKTRDLHRAEPRHDLIKSHHIQEEVHDPYKPRAKPEEPCVCPKCGAVDLDGRWQWPRRKVQALQEELCPACRRAADNYPAGEIFLSGSFAASHKQEILDLVRNTEQAEKAEHPLQRIMSIDDAEGQITIRTTDIHLPRRIGHAIFGAFKGELDTRYDRDGYFVRVTWKRDG